MTTYEEFSREPVSEKVTVAHIEPSGRLLLWNREMEAIYSRKVSHYVVGVRMGTTELVNQSHAILAPGQWYYDGENSKVYMRMPDDSNPQNAYVSAIYRLFFSDGPHKLSFDLSANGQLVDYEPIIASGGRFSAAVSSTDQLGIALESSGQITLHNTHGYFDGIFDKLFFEQKRVRIYSWSPEIAFNEAKLLFDGEITGKSFDDQKVTFKLKDFIHKLRQTIKLGLFSKEDGTITDSVAGKPKRAIYGRAVGVRAQSVDMIVDGYPLPETFTFNKGQNRATASGNILEFLSPGDNIKFSFRGQSYSYGVKEIVSETEITLSDESQINAANINCLNLPDRPYLRKNRRWMVAGHKLRQPQTTISSVADSLYFNLDDIRDFEIGDNITVNGIAAKIVRIVGSGVVIDQQLPFTPERGAIVAKNPVDGVWYDKRKLFFGRDYQVENGPEGCFVVLSEYAERNITGPKSLTGTVGFTKGSTTLTGQNSIFTKELQSRDWIKSQNIAHPDWYEILEVIDDTQIKLRRPFGGENHTGQADINTPNLIGDNSILAVDCIGKENSRGKWIRTASDVVKDLLEEAGIDNIEETSFNEALSDAPYTVSLKLPLSFGRKIPLVREAITLVNKSVFGSLVNNTDYNVAYKALTPDRPPDMPLIKDDDILDFSVKSKTDIIKKFTLRYAHFDSDRFEPGNKGSKVMEHTSSFVENLIGTPKERTIDVYLFRDSDVKQIIERYALFHELSQSVVSIKTKLNLATLSVGDKLQLQFDRLYERFGDNQARIKVGVVNKIVKSGTETLVEITDLGNIFNRVACICDDTAADFPTASQRQRAIHSYICDNQTQTPDPAFEDAWGCNLVG